MLGLNYKHDAFGIFKKSKVAQSQGTVPKLCLEPS